MILKSLKIYGISPAPLMPELVTVHIMIRVPSECKSGRIKGLMPRSFFVAKPCVFSGVVTSEFPFYADVELENDKNSPDIIHHIKKINRISDVEIHSRIKCSEVKNCA